MPMFVLSPGKAHIGDGARRRFHNTRNGQQSGLVSEKNSGKIRSANGKIALLDEENNETASWSFSSMLKHWNRKHNQACYIPSLSESKPNRRYWYGSEIILGTGTDFQLFLRQMAIGNIYYDPGIKLENLSSAKPKIKKRSQFRIKSGYIPDIYTKNEVISVLQD